MYDLLVEFENYIVGEQIIRCEHCLFGLKMQKSPISVPFIPISRDFPSARAFFQEHRTGNRSRLRIPQMAEKSGRGRRCDAGICFQCLCGKMFRAESVKRKYLQQQGKFYEIYHCDKSENLSERCEEDQHLF